MQMNDSTAKECPRCGDRLTPKDGKSKTHLHCRACNASYRATSKSGVKTSESENGEPKATANTPAASSRTLDRFELKRLLGKGGFGKVFLAYDPRLEREVAIKVPTFSSKNRRRVARFRAEAKTAAMLRHPNIVQTFESGESQGTLYIVSQYVEGEPLTKYLEQEELDFTQIAIWVESIARALHYAHEHRVVHRDIKPDNILIDQSGEPQIMDFGLAKQEGREGVTQDGAIVGTIAYMSPEQARGDDDQVAATSDQYSLGVILYEMLCQSKPYDGASHVILTKVADPQTEPAPPRTRQPSVPKDLDVICLKAMANQVGDRYQNCQEMADDLQRWRNDLPITARRSTIPERTFRFCRRNPVVSTLTAALALAFAFSVGLQIRNFQLGRQNSVLIAENVDWEQKNTEKKQENAKLSQATIDLGGQIEDLERQRVQLDQEKKDAEQLKEDAEEAKREAVAERQAVEASLANVSEDLTAETAKLNSAKSQLKLVQYQSHMQLASQNINSKNYPRAQSELKKCEPELRGWEWQYLQTKSTQRIWSRQFDSDVLGQLCLNKTNANLASEIALLTADGLEIIDAATGETAANGRLLSAQVPPLNVTQPRFVPVPPGVRWNPLKTDPNSRFLSLTTQEPDGSYRLRVWDLASEARDQIVLELGNQDATFTDPPGMIAVAANGAFGMYNTDTWKLMGASADLIDPLRLNSLRFNLPRFVGFPRVTQLRDPEQITLGEKFCKASRPTERTRDILVCKYVELSGDRQSVLAIVEKDSRLQLIVISRHREATTTKFDVIVKLGEPDPAGKYCLSYDGKKVAAILSDNACVFDAESGDRIATIGPAEDIAFVGGKGENAALLTINKQQAELFSLGFDQPDQDLLPTLKSYQSLAFSPQYLAGLDNEHFLWVGSKREDGQYIKLATPPVGIEKNSLTEVSYSADGKMIIAHGRTAAYRFSPDGRTEFEKILLTEKNGHSGTVVRTLRLRPGGNDFLTIDIEGKVVAWKSGDQGYQPVVFSNEAVEFAPQGDAVWIDDRRIACTTASRKSDAGGQVQSPIWNIESGEIESWVPITGLVLETDPGQTRLIAGTGSGVVDIFRIERQGDAIQIIDQPNVTSQLFSGSVSAIALFPDTQHIAVAGDGQLKIIDSVSGAELISLDSPFSEIVDLAVSRDGKAIAACGREEGIWLLNPGSQEN